MVKRRDQIDEMTNGHRAAGNSTFRKLWEELTRSVIIGRPMTDLCWFCQKNNIAIYRSSNLPDCVKSAKLRKQEEHLRTVGVERQAYQEMVASCKETARELGVQLGPNQPCSRDITISTALTMHSRRGPLPSDPLQPGPFTLWFPGRGLVGVCCEGAPQQVNYLIDEAHCSSKGSNAVIAFLHHFFSQYGLGEKHVHLHCDNCSGQNKNRYLLWYLAWRCMVGLHEDISLNFLIAGHTTCAPDWCFGLFKQQFRRTPVSCLKDTSPAVRSSTVTGVNSPQLYSILDVAVARPALYARGLQVLWRCFQLLARQLRLRHAAGQKAATLKGELGLWKQKAGEALQRLEVLQQPPPLLRTA
ncbi:hypothetical protein KUCAC02_036010, partial [Chaenocephalus aceratus]